MRASNTQVRIPFVSAVYFHFRHNQLSLYINIVCFDSIGSKDNLVQLSGAVRQAFSCMLFMCKGSEKAHVWPPYEWNI